MSTIQFQELAGKKILITGGLGFIGSNIAHASVKAGARVTLYDCLDPKSGGNMQNIEGIKEDVELVINDIRNFEGVCSVIQNKDILFNCAAYTSHPNSMKEPLLDIDINCKGVIHLLEGCRRFNPAIKFMQIGTSTQIGVMHQNPVDEWHAEFPLDIYSANKSVAEKYTLIYGNAYGLHTTVVRLANVYGPRCNILSPDFGFMGYFIGLALQNKKITVFGQGEQLRSLCYIDDAVNALLISSLESKSDRQVYFVTGDRQHTVEEIALTVVKAIGGEVIRVEWPKVRESIEIGSAVITNHKFREAFDWTPSIGLLEGMERTRDYFATCLKSYLK